MKYLLVGTDSYRAMQFIREISQKEYRIIDSAAEIDQTLLTLDQLGLFGNTPLTVFRNLLGKLDVHADALVRTQAPVVIWEEKETLDTRKKVIKELVSAFTRQNYEPLDPARAVEWIIQYCQSRQIEIGRDGARLLIDYHGPNLAILSSEIDKISLFVRKEDRSVIAASHVKELSLSSVEANIFEIYDHVTGRNLKALMRSLHNFRDSNPDEWYLFILLVKQMRNLLQLKLKVKPDAHPYAIQKLTKVLSLWDDSEVYQSYKDLLEIEVRVKKGESELWPEIIRWSFERVVKKDVT